MCFHVDYAWVFIPRHTYRYNYGNVSLGVLANMSISVYMRRCMCIYMSRPVYVYINMNVHSC